MNAAWVVRTGRNGERDGWSLNNVLARGGWDEIPDLTPCESRDQVRSTVSEIYGGSLTNSGLNNYTAQLWALRARIEPGRHCRPLGL